MKTFHCDVVDLGRAGYLEALEVQRRHHAEVLGSREGGAPMVGRVLVVEHPPVITVSRRASAGANLLATPAMLEKAGVEVCETDRGGNITYHGPGQIVVYPILDLNTLNLGLHEYMRLLESAVIQTLAEFGVGAFRDESATGVWTSEGQALGPAAKIAAMGVRVKKWVTMHGLALNVEPDLSHFGLIVPCGLAGRPVTSLKQILGAACPAQVEVARTLCAELQALIRNAASTAEHRRSLA